MDAILQLIRGLTTAQVRQQLEYDEQHNVDRLFSIYHFSAWRRSGEYPP